MIKLDQISFKYLFLNIENVSVQHEFRKRLKEVAKWSHAQWYKRTNALVYLSPADKLLISKIYFEVVKPQHERFRLTELLEVKELNYDILSDYIE